MIGAIAGGILFGLLSDRIGVVRRSMIIALDAQSHVRCGLRSIIDATDCWGVSHAVYGTGSWDYPRAPSELSPIPCEGSSWICVSMRCGLVQAQ